MTIFFISDTHFGHENIIKYCSRPFRDALGNHDNDTMENYRRVGFQKIMGARVFDGILFTHYPVHPMSAGDNGNDKVKIKGNAHGHIHEKPSPPEPYVNLSVEWTNYTPVALEEVQSRLRKSQ